MATLTHVNSTSSEGDSGIRMTSWAMRNRGGVSGDGVGE